MPIDEDADEFTLFFRAIPLALLAAFIGLLWFRPPPPPPPANSVVFGCYGASDSPNIKLDEKGMHILQRGFPVIGYHLENLKTGITLTTEAPIRIYQAGDFYRFGMYRRGEGQFLPFYRIQDGRTYGIFDATYLHAFQISAEDGRNLKYEPVDTARCAIR